MSWKCVFAVHFWCCKRNALKILVIAQSFIILFNIVHYTTLKWIFGGMWLSLAEVNESRTLFLNNYFLYCEAFLLPKMANLLAMNITHSSALSSSSLCPCIPDNLIEGINFSLEVPPPLIGELELQHYELLPGGQWFPANCLPRHRIAVIVPFRDRELHLRHFLSVIHPFLQRQLLQYTVFVVEQAAPNVFNKASLMNAGFLEAESLADFDCYIFHDVDMLPETDLNFYTCSLVPRHVGSHLDKWNYILPYEELFGGVTAFSREHFIKVNGFSNQYYGWGGEDDDMYYRIVAQNLDFVRFPETIARYMMLKHEHDAGNPVNRRRLSLLYHKDRERIYANDGLNSIRYKLRSFKARPLYTWLELELPSHPAYIDDDFWATRISGSKKSSHTFTVFVQLLFFIFLIHCS